MAAVKPTRIEELNAKRQRAVELRLAGLKWRDISAQTGLSIPTLVSAFKSFNKGGWAAVPVNRRGRRIGQGSILSGALQLELQNVISMEVPSRHGLPSEIWSSHWVRAFLQDRWQVSPAPRTLSRLLSHLGLSVRWLADGPGEDEAARRWLARDWPALRSEVQRTETSLYWCAPREFAVQGRKSIALAAATPRRQVFWRPVRDAGAADEWIAFFDVLLQSHGGRLALLLHGIDITRSAALRAATDRRADRLLLLPCPVNLWSNAHHRQPSTHHRRTTVSQRAQGLRREPMIDGVPPPGPCVTTPTMTAPIAASHVRQAAMHVPTKSPAHLTHLQRLEAESIHIIREVVAECDKPVMLYSIGKDSAVMLHLARKAFHPAVPPFPLLHVDTTWKFREMYAMRDRMVRESGMELIVHVNRQGVEMGINPFTHGSQIHTDVMKTQALKQALDEHGFDAAFGGARRDEEKSRAKERIFSFRTAQHRWDPKNQRPELWHLYNAHKHKGESIRVFPLSNWTELDVWQYIWMNDIPVVPLYLAKPRPVVERDGMLIMVDDERMPLKPGEVPMMRKVRFRTLGCYPLTGAIESEAEQLTDVIREMLLTRTSERQGRLIDHDQSASMEKKKQEGYF